MCQFYFPLIERDQEGYSSPYISNVKTYYSKNCQPYLQNKYFPQVQQASFINLALFKTDLKMPLGDDYGMQTIQGNADDIIAKKEAVTYMELFRTASNGTRILIEGRPGSGKTTLLNKVNRDWAAGNVLTSSTLLVYVPLRRFHNRETIDLKDIVGLYGSGPLVNDVANHISHTGGQNVCIIVDGLDEYLFSSDSGSYILDLMQGNQLPNAVVIAASRPVAACELRKYATKHVEVLGFLRHQIKQYIDEYYRNDNTENAAQLSAYLERHPNIRNMCYLPLHLTMIVYLNEFQGGNSLNLLGPPISYSILIPKELEEGKN